MTQKNNTEESITTPTDDQVARQLQRLAEAKQAIANGETIKVAVPFGEIVEVAGVPFTIGRVKPKCLTLIPVRGYELCKESHRQKLIRLRKEADER